MVLETSRLLLRPWEASDAGSLYRYASDPAVGPIAGWPPHQNMEESQEVITKVLSGKECYAICLKTHGQAIGAIELMPNTDLAAQEGEWELGYWLGKPYWGQGIMPEAAGEIIRHGFEEAGAAKIWCGYYEGNTRSRRVQEKLGFRFQHKYETAVPLLHERRICHVSCLTRDQWEWDRMYAAAKAVQNGRKISAYVDAGGVAAAVLSASGKIYTGVCVDSACTLGICAERNAIFHMLTEGEQEIRKVLAIMPDGRCGAPCGACRELMVQLMPNSYGAIQILMDRETEKTVTLGDLTPAWWI